MLTKTSETGIQALIYLALQESSAPRSPRVIAAELGLSSSYLSKITGQLVRASVLTAHRGAKGGVTLSRPPAEILLLDIVQALQGTIVGKYCESKLPLTGHVCAFHEAMLQIHRATIDLLCRWTLADLAARPAPTGLPRGTPSACLMHPALQAIRRKRFKRSPGAGTSQ